MTLEPDGLPGLVGTAESGGPSLPEREESSNIFLRLAPGSIGEDMSEDSDEEYSRFREEVGVLYCRLYGFSGLLAEVNKADCVVMEGEAIDLVVDEDGIVEIECRLFTPTFLTTSGFIASLST